MRTLTLALLLLCSNLLQAQNFTKKADFPGGQRWYLSSFATGDKVYTLCGFDSTTTGHSGRNDLWQYSTTSDTWTQKANLPFMPRTLMSTMVINGTAYAGFGYDTTLVNRKDWWKYNEASDTWTQLPDFPGTERYGAYAFTWNGRGYILAGSSFDHTMGHALNDFWEFNPANNAWTKLGDFPGAGRALGFSQVIGDTLYMGLGEDDSLQAYYHDNFKCYLPAKTWSAMPAIPATANVAEVSGFVSFQAHAGNRVMLMDLDIDYTIPSDLKMVYLYNLNTSMWTLSSMGNIPGFRVAGFASQIGSKAYMGLGSDYYSNAWPGDMWEVNMQNFALSIEAANPALAQISVGAEGHTIHAAIPESIVQKGPAELVLYSMDGKLIKTYPLPGTACTLDARELPSAAYTYAIRSAGRMLVAGQVVLH